VNISQWDCAYSHGIIDEFRYHRLTNGLSHLPKEDLNVCDPSGFYCRSNQSRFTLILLVVGFITVLSCRLNASPASVNNQIESIAPLDGQAAMRQGEQLLRQGQFEQAVVLLNIAVQFYSKMPTSAPHIKALIRFGEAQQALGEYVDASEALHQALPLAKSLKEIGLSVHALAALGNLQIALGAPQQAEQLLNEASTLASNLQAPALKATILNNLANHYRLQNNPQQAMKMYLESAQLAKQNQAWLLAAQALANAARLALKNEDWQQAEQLANEAIALPKNTLNPHDTAYLLINLGRTLSQLNEKIGEPDNQRRLRAFQLFNEAKQIASAANDLLAASYALGYTGQLYEIEQRYQEALIFTSRAIFQAQQLSPHDTMHPLFLWHWQTGRLQNQLKNRPAAIDAYQNAVDKLATLRHLQNTNDGDDSLSFKEAIAPVYLQLVDLMLQDSEQIQDPTQLSDHLQQVRNTVEQMKAAELRDYFRDDCVDRLQAKTKDVSEISPSAVVIYPILLAQRVELLLSFPGGSMQRYTVPVPVSQFIEEVRKFRRLLEKRTTHQHRKPGRRLYQWLIKPFEAEFAKKHINTLVFVPDGALRTIPMAALYDNGQYLIEKYAVATTPSVNLTDPQPLDRNEINAVYGGLSESVQGFPSLTHVPEELNGIQALYDGPLLLNRAFTGPRLKDILTNNSINVLHIATHAKFSANADDSYLLTYDGRVSINQLSEYIGLFKFREKPLELLVLSACETAQSDDRAALGLSGIAIKAGARSALGTLWKVDDAASSALIRGFYQELKNPNHSRAVALQRAQQYLIQRRDFRHPGYWSAYILINSWL